MGDPQRHAGGVAPAERLRRIEELAESDDSAMTYSDILTVVSNNRSREWINERIVDPEGE